MEAEHKNWLKVPEVAEELSIPRSRAYELVANGELPAVRIGERSIRVHRGELAARIEELEQDINRENGGRKTWRA